MKLSPLPHPGSRNIEGEFQTSRGYGKGTFKIILPSFQGEERLQLMSGLHIYINSIGSKYWTTSRSFHGNSQKTFFQALSKSSQFSGLQTISELSSERSSRHLHLQSFLAARSLWAVRKGSSLGVTVWQVCEPGLRNRKRICWNLDSSTYSAAKTNHFIIQYSWHQRCPWPSGYRKTGEGSGEKARHPR